MSISVQKLKAYGLQKESLEDWVSRLPKKILWTELLFSYFPIDKKVFGQQMLARFSLLFSVWLAGLLAYSLDGLMMPYITNLQIYPILFGTSFTILFGSYMMQRELNRIVPRFRRIPKLDEVQFDRFSERIERYSYSFLPCLFLATGFVVFLSGAPAEFQRGLAEGFSLHVIWDLSYNFFVQLLVGTAVWWLVSIWVTVFLISRQPLDVRLSAKTVEKFRGLSVLALWLSFGYFVGLSIGIVTSSAGVPALSLLEIVVSPYLFFIAIGVIGILLPFYNIHNALLRLKKQELLAIEEESEQLLQQLDEVLAKQPARQVGDRAIAIMAQTTAIMARLFGLRAKERHVEAAQEWPIDAGFLSKLMGMGLLPVVGRIAQEILLPV